MKKTGDSLWSCFEGPGYASNQRTTTAHHESRTVNLSIKKTMQSIFINLVLNFSLSKFSLSGFYCYTLKKIINLQTELQCMVFAKTNTLCLDMTFIQDLRKFALTNSVSVHMRSRSTSPDLLFLLMLILSISCRTASAVLKYIQQLTHTKYQF